MSRVAVRQTFGGGRDATGRPSSLRRLGIPLASVTGASMVPALLPQIAVTPWLPPLGLLVLIAWRLLRPELFPLWIGLPLGLVDDAFSGQPLGTATGLWALVILMLDHADRRLIWRGFWHDWALTAALSPIIILAGGALTLRDVAIERLVVILWPQMLATVVAYPFAVRLVAFLDRLRLRGSRRMRG